ncbi:monocarboxylate transporter 13 [Elysia marginata]|uniref:Monocarboxylate transporter 13 n=1 Tax=Elysia marginata TaxID=1093978 RepID=A0AAV4IDP0_9GAST|nr:monocarboxylate transporter 13 [Elysia marginata]
MGTVFNKSLFYLYLPDLGPIPAHLASKFGYRCVVVTGGLMAGAGYILAYFATNIYFLVLAIGLVSGSGCGFCFLPATVTVAMYFDRRRSLAIGLGSAGVGIGSFVCAPVFHLLIEQYGWRGALLVTGAIQLNLCVIGLLLRPLPPDSAEVRVHVQSPVDGHSVEELCEVNDSLLHPAEKAYSMQQIANVDASGAKKNLGAMDRIRSQIMGGSARHLSPASNTTEAAVFYSANELRHRAGLSDGEFKAPSSRNHSANLDIMMCGSVHSLFLIDKGAYTTLAAVVIVDLVGVELLGHAYGLMLLFTGVAGLFGPPMAGEIFDLTGNYTISYVVHGLFILVSGLMLVPVAAMRKR